MKMKVRDTSCLLIFVIVSALHQDIKSLEKPRISQDTRHVLSGQNLSLYCSISTTVGSMFIWKWRYPTSVPARRIQKHLGKSNWDTKLTVKNVESGDAGEYVCIANNLLLDDVEARSSINIQVWDPDYKYINMSVEGDIEHFYSRVDDTAQWTVLIDAYPEEFALTWWTESGTEINTNETDPRSRYSHDVTGTRHVFGISGLDFEDTGNYTIHVKTSHGESSIVLPLTVEGQPMIQLPNIEEYYAPGEVAVFTSCIIGSPLPNVTWNYIEYPDFPSKENSQLIPILNFTEERMEEKRFHLQSVTSMTMNTTGDLQCKACNEVDCTEITYTIYVSGIFTVTEVNRFSGIDPPGVPTVDTKMNSSGRGNRDHLTIKYAIIGLWLFIV